MSMRPSDQDFAVGEPRSVDLRGYVAAVRRRWAIVLVAVIVGGVGGFAYAHFGGTSYSATAEVYVLPATQGPLNPPARPDLLVNMATETAVVSSGPVVHEAGILMHTALTQQKLQATVGKDLAVVVPVLSDVLQITWKAGTAKAAQVGANAFATAYLQYRHSQLVGQVSGLEAALNQQLVPLDKQIATLRAYLSTLPFTSPKRTAVASQLSQYVARWAGPTAQLSALQTYNLTGGTVLSAQLPPSSHTGLSHKSTEVLGVLLGLLIGLILALLRDTTDGRVRDAAQLERELAVATLAVLPRATSGGWAGGGRLDPARATARRAITTLAAPDSRSAEAVRALRATLVAMGAGRHLKVILLANTDPAESSSRFAADLGVAMAESGRHTVLIGTDLRASTLSQIFGMTRSTGVSNVLAGEGTPEAFIQRPGDVGGIPLAPPVADRLMLLPNGPLLARPLSVLDSDAMVDMLKRLRDHHDLVLLDCPPFDESEDVVALAGLVDGVLVIAGEARTHRRVLDELRAHLHQVGATIIGGVLMSKYVIDDDDRSSSRNAEAPARRARHSSAGAKVSAGPRPGRRGEPADAGKGYTELPA
jgi:Mrp family chromosome partitioning ATPase